MIGGFIYDYRLYLPSRNSAFSTNGRFWKATYQRLAPYSDRMKKLIKDPEAFYKPKERPSGHSIGKSFGKDNGGAIPPNLLSFPNSESNGKYVKRCKAVSVKAHPARFPNKLPEFFVKMLTEPEDTVLDIFSGSNTTGEVAERLGRRWMAFEENREYVAASAFRFTDGEDDLQEVYDRILAEEVVRLEQRQNVLDVNQ